MIHNTHKRYLHFFLVLIYLLFQTEVFAQLGAEYKAFELAEKLQCEIFYEAISKTLTFSKSNTKLTCVVGENMLILGDGSIEFFSSPTQKNNTIYIPQDMGNRIESFFSQQTEAESFFKVGAILIDPGHGGKDPGAIGEYTENGKKISIYEKTVVLKVAQELTSLLKQAFPDKKIIMTRTGDTYPTLEERVNMANNVKLADNEAIIYISIHANSSFNKTASGFEVWYLPRDYKRNDLTDGKNISNEIRPIVNSMLEEEFSLESILLASNILDQLNVSIGNQSPSRGLKEQAWFVVRNAKMPAVLIELGFVSNEKEAKLLNNSTYLKKCANGIYNGIVQFVSQIENYGLK